MRSVTLPANCTAAVVTGVGSDVDDVVGGRDDVEVVLDEDQGAALVDEAVKELEESAGAPAQRHAR